MSPSKEWSMVVTRAPNAKWGVAAPSKKSFAERFRILDPFHCYTRRELHEIDGLIRKMEELGWC